MSQPAAIAFNEAINRRDLDALAGLMTDDHAFIDSEDNVLVGKAEVLEAWSGFFRAFPDYRNDWSELKSTEHTLIALGQSVCSTDPALAGPAIWRATIVADQIAEWRVYDDTTSNRARLGLATDRGT
jgi:ketosteroid isomerase-like protein